MIFLFSYNARMETKITATELARNLSDILNRVRYKGESFCIERNGELIAVLGPGPAAKALTVAEFRRRYAGVKVPEGMTDALEEGWKALGPLPESPWPSS